MMDRKPVHTERAAFNTTFTLEQMQRQCRSWMTDLRSYESEMRLLKEMVMDHAADLEDKNELLRFRYNAGLLNSELGNEARELIDHVRRLENMINYEIDEKMTVSIEDINLDHLNIKRRFNDFSSEYMDVKDELVGLLGSYDDPDVRPKTFIDPPSVQGSTDLPI